MVLTKVVEINKENCVNCHKCIAVCPVKFCNDGSGEYVTIREDLCIACGECIIACDHDARRKINDFELMLNAISKNEKLIAIVAPAIAAEFPDQYLYFNGWLKSLGVVAIFDVSFGAELTVKSYLEHIKKNNPKCVIAQPCPAIVNYIELYQPELLEYLAPADSPMLHTLKMIKTFYKEYDGYRQIVISPCIAKKREFEETGFGDFNVTMDSIKEYLINKRINLKNYPEVGFDNPEAERAVLFSTPGGLLRTVQREFPNVVNIARKIEGPEVIYKYLKELKHSIDKGTNPLIIDCLNCEMGCNGGTGTSKELSHDELEFNVEKRNTEMQNRYKKKGINKTKSAAKRRINKEINKYWKPDLYKRNYIDRSKEVEKILKIPSELELNNIFIDMLKETKKDELNCSACGYNTCEEMAIAIFNNLNKKENCHHYVNKHLSRSVSEMLVEIDKFAEGDLTMQLPVNGEDDIAKLYRGFNKSVTKISDLISNLMKVIQTVTEASYQISSSTEQMAAGAQEQSSQATEIAESMDIMTQTIKQNTRSAEKAVEKSKLSGEIAVDGGKIVEMTVEGMLKITDVVNSSAAIIRALGNNSNKIGEIIDVIKGIADQTNLLALNAAIEAARAGEFGRGFAVVADEVRKLSDHTTKATVEIEKMINDIQKDTQSAVTTIKIGTEEVSKGKEYSEKAGESLKQIITSSKEAIELANLVAIASDEQANTITEISKRVEGISSVTQQSAAGTQEIATSAEELIKLTTAMSKLINKFRVNNLSQDINQ